MRILAVCLGNICRSPLAEGLLRKVAAEAGQTWQVDSAGTGNYHVGEAPDPRSIAVAAENDLDISYQKARQVEPADFERYDLLFAMDRSNYRHLLRLAPTPEHRQKVHLILEYADPDNPGGDVPDPYWDDDGFARVYQMLENAARNIVGRLAGRRNAAS